MVDVGPKVIEVLSNLEFTNLTRHIESSLILTVLVEDGLPGQVHGFDGLHVIAFRDLVDDCCHVDASSHEIK